MTGHSQQHFDQQAGQQTPTGEHKRHLDKRQIAIMLAGICAFLNLYNTQSLLPHLQTEFHTTMGAVSLTLSATTFAVALLGPLAGSIADCYGRRRVLLWAVFAMGLTTLLLAYAPSLNWIIALRFLTGVCIPGIFTSALAYIGEEWPVSETAKVTSLYISGNVLGGFLGRFLTGLLTEHLGWKPAFIVMGLLTLACWPIIGRWLPRPKHFHATDSVGASLASIPLHLKVPALTATYAVGFGILFSQVATFTYIAFHLAAKPFSLHPDTLGAIFAIYLIGMVMTPLAGRWTQRFGRHNLLVGAMILGSLGMLLTLIPNLWIILLGLTLSSASVFASQAAASSFVPLAAESHRSTAVGLYVSCYYLGGSLGAYLPSLLWQRFEWSGCVFLVIAVQLLIARLGYRHWRMYASPVPVV